MAAAQDSSPNSTPKKRESLVGYTKKLSWWAAGKLSDVMLQEDIISPEEVASSLSDSSMSDIRVILPLLALIMKKVVRRSKRESLEGEADMTE